MNGSGEFLAVKKARAEEMGRKKFKGSPPRPGHNHGQTAADKG